MEKKELEKQKVPTLEFPGGPVVKTQEHVFIYIYIYTHIHKPSSELGMSLPSNVGKNGHEMPPKVWSDL